MYHTYTTHGHICGPGSSGVDNTDRGPGNGCQPNSFRYDRPACVVELEPKVLCGDKDRWVPLEHPGTLEIYGQSTLMLVQ